MMKSSVILAMFCATAQAEEVRSFEPDAVSLANRVADCSPVFAPLVKKDFKAFRAAEVVTQDTDGFPIREISKTTSVLLGKDLQPMGGYRAIALVEVRTHEKCFGNPRAGGTCAETTLSCRMRWRGPGSKFPDELFPRAENP